MIQTLEGPVGIIGSSFCFNQLLCPSSKMKVLFELDWGVAWH